MSARTPFMPPGDQPKSTPPPNLTASVFTFVPNPGNALHRGPSGQANSDAENSPRGLDLNKSLPLAGLLGQRPNKTASHGTSAPKNLLQMTAVATLNRPQTAAPGHGNRYDSAGRRMSLNNKANTNNFEGIMSPVPIKIAQQKPSILTSPTIDSFKTPTLPSQVDADHSLGLFNAHISNGPRSQRRTAGTPVRQQPSPDPSNQSGSSDEQMDSVGVSGPFRTSTPLGHGVREVLARRVSNHDDHTGYYDRASLSNNRRHPRDHNPNEGDQIRPPLKRQKSSLEPPSRGSVGHSAPLGDGGAPDESSFQQYRGHSDIDVSTHPCILGQILKYNVDRLLPDQVEHFNNRVDIWETSSDEDWKEGAEELKQKFSNMLNKTQAYMKRKQDLFEMLESRIATHQEHLQDREQALTVVRQNLVNESQNVLGGRFTG